MSASPLWVIMPLIDCLADTREAVADVLAQTQPCRLLLINNGSTNDTREVLEQWQLAHEADQRVLVWHHDPPLPSLSATWNRALDFVWATGAHHAWVLNNDVRVRPWMAQALLEAFTLDPQALFVSGVGVRTMADTPAALPDGWERGRGGPDFSCFVASRTWHAAYRFDERFIPAYCEDLDLHRRMLLAGDGHRIYSVTLPYVHLASRTVNRSPEARAKWDRLAGQSRAYYERKWGGPVNHETFDVPFGAFEEDIEEEQNLFQHTCGITTPDLHRAVSFVHPMATPQGL